MPAKDPKAYAQAYYERNKDKVRNNLRKYRQRNRQFVRDAKQGQTCINCGFNDPRALVYHHRDPTQKDKDVWHMMQHGYGLQRIKREIDKCDLLCANCHLIEHYNDNTIVPPN